MKKKLNIISAILLILGLLIFFGTLIVIGFNFDELVNITEETVRIEGSFEKIFIETESADITVLPSTDGECKMVKRFSEGTSIDYELKDNELKISVTEEMESVFSIGENSVLIYLPKSFYKSLKVDGSSTDVTINKIDFESCYIAASTGDVSIKANINALNVQLSTGKIDIDDAKVDKFTATVTTGDVKIKNTEITRDIELESSTGNLSLEGVAVGGNLSANTSTGEFEARNVTVGTINVKTNSGKVDLENVLSNGKINLETSSGDVEFERCDATELNIKTSSGDVEGSFLSNKIFYVTTDSGEVSVPKSTQGGICQVETSSGDVELSLLN